MKFTHVFSVFSNLSPLFTIIYELKSTASKLNEKKCRNFQFKRNQTNKSYFILLKVPKIVIWTTKYIHRMCFNLKKPINLLYLFKLAKIYDGDFSFNVSKKISRSVNSCWWLRDIMNHQNHPNFLCFHKKSMLWSKLYIPSTLNIDLIQWHTHLNVCAVKC